jgi:alkyl hydroperoxide reductase subunit AhpC
MAYGVTLRLPATAACISRCSRILNRRVRLRKKYCAYREDEGVCERALFVLDRQGVIFWSCCSPVAVNPGADGILDALERLEKRDGRDGNAASSSHAA